MAEGNKEYMPRLRFPEFHGGETWIQTPLKDVALLKNGYAFKSKNYVSNGKYKIVTISNVKSGYFDKGNMNTINELPSDIQKHQILNIGDILISMTGNVGRVCRVDAEQCLLNQRVGKIIPFGVNNIFLYHIFQTDIFIDNMKIKAIGGAQGNLSVSSIQEYKVCYPRNEEEQQKIADCLSSLDELIEAHGQKRDSLLEHKKGLMQRLFPAEGENTPRWRFPEFRQAKKWDTALLGTLTTKIGSGVTPRGGEQNYLPSGVPFVRSQNVGWGKLLLNDIAFIPYDIHETLLSTELQLEDVLLNITGASIGRCALVDNEISGGNVNQHVCIIRVKKEKLNSVFLMQYIISAMGQKQIDSYQAGGNRQGLNFAQVAAFDIPLPSLPEQQKIADCLSSLDDRIEAEEDKITSLREHKQGLMQRLFPQSL